MSGNVDLLRKAYARWEASKGRDIDGWLEIFAPDGRIGSLAAGAPGAEFSRGGQGVEAAREYLEHLTRDWEMRSQRMDDYVVDGDRVVVLGDCTWRRRADGQDVSTAKADIWRFRDGQAIEFFEFYDTAAVRGLL